MLGQEVSTLMDRAMPAGTYSSVWDGRAAGGAPAASGLYLYKLQATRLEGAAAGADHLFVETRKMLLLK
jgi:hypothetical protein